MSQTRTRSIREFVLDRVVADPTGVAREVAQAYGISRQAANRHLDVLVGDGLLKETGQTRARRYELQRTASLSREFRVTPVLNPDRVWDDHVALLLTDDREGVRSLCRGAFGELVRNAIAHANASWVSVGVATTARHIDIFVADDGGGIFVRVAQVLGVGSPRLAAEEVAARARRRSVDSPAVRLTLLARNFELFSIRSSGLELVYRSPDDEWTLTDNDSSPAGTTVAFRAKRFFAAGAGTRQRPRALTRSTSR